jgi:hypothetical protein
MKRGNIFDVAANHRLLPMWTRTMNTDVAVQHIQMQRAISVFANKSRQKVVFQI